MFESRLSPAQLRKLKPSGYGKKPDAAAVALKGVVNADPLAELGRLLAKSREHFAVYRSLMPTRLNPAGTTDRAVLNAAVERARRERG